MYLITVCICTMSESSMEGEYLILNNTGFIEENDSSRDSVKRDISQKMLRKLDPSAITTCISGISLRL